MSVEHSRALRLAAGVSDLDEPTLKERQEAALVTVRLDQRIAEATLTARVLLTTLRRLPGRLALDRTGLDDATVREIIEAVAAIDSTRPLMVTDGPAADATAQVDIGLAGETGFIRLVPDGYGAQLATDPSVELAIGRPANALGAVLAAALAAAESFKQIVVDKEHRRTAHPHLSFCPVTLTADTTGAPELPAVALDAGMIGNGAIGTAIVLILSELRLGGRLVLCDPETYAPENKGTYSLGGEREAREKPPKVDLAATVLEASGYTTVKVPETSTELIRRIDEGQLSAPPVVLAGLDTAYARRETQMLFPDHIIDAATGDTAVGLHHARPAGACLRCFVPEPIRRADPLIELAHKTGLPIARLKRGDDPLTEADLTQLSPERRECLQAFIGRPVCGLAAALGLTNADSDGYMPAVPFVAQMAACLAVGRLIAVLADLDTRVNFFQFDALHGPLVEGESRHPDPGCFCQERAGVVRELRARRYGPDAASAS